jgi:hypothetical protein
MLGFGRRRTSVGGRDRCAQCDGHERIARRTAVLRVVNEMLGNAGVDVGC